MRDDFTGRVKDILSRRAGMRCSNPECQRPTAGPCDDLYKAVNVGVAAHITAAAEGGARFDPNLSADERKRIDNGIWLCQLCAKLIDNDPQKYTTHLLREWKSMAEYAASLELRQVRPQKYPNLVLEEIDIYCPPEQRVYYLTFTLANIGTGIAAVESLLLNVVQVAELCLPEAPREGAVLHMTDLEVHLRPDILQYDLGAGYLVYRDGDIDGFRLKITAEEGYSYDVQAEVTWHSVGSIPKHMLLSSIHRCNFYIHSRQGFDKIIRQQRKKK